MSEGKKFLRNHLLFIVCPYLFMHRKRIILTFPTLPRVQIQKFKAPMDQKVNKRKNMCLEIYTDTGTDKNNTKDELQNQIWHGYS